MLRPPFINRNGVHPHIVFVGIRNWGHPFVSAMAVGWRNPETPAHFIKIKIKIRDSPKMRRLAEKLK
jgi:hypothetical protein